MSNNHRKLAIKMDVSNQTAMDIYDMCIQVIKDELLENNEVKLEGIGTLKIYTIDRAIPFSKNNPTSSTKAVKTAFKKCKQLDRDYATFQRSIINNI